MRDILNQLLDCLEKRIVVPNIARRIPLCCKRLIRNGTHSSLEYIEFHLALANCTATDDEPGSEVSLRKVLEHFLIQHQVRDRLLEPGFLPTPSVA